MHTLDKSILSTMSRREFLKCTGSALLSLFLCAAAPSIQGVTDAPSMGRVTDKSVVIYDRPNYSGKIVKYYWQDLVFPITGITIGDVPEHNRFWYELNGEGFVHSGSVQPVKIKINTPLNQKPEKDVLAEVSVPYTDAYQKPARDSKIDRRLYYQTTHWVTDVIVDNDNHTWYKLLDDAFKQYYFADGRHLRILPASDLTALSGDIPPDEKHIVARLSEQVVIAYEGDEPVFVSRMSSGAKFSNGNFQTPPGSYQIRFKRPSRHMTSGSPAAPNSYDLPGVPWCCFITESGISFHGTYWHNDFGRPRSHGCMNLPSDAARWIYRWTFPGVPADKQWAYHYAGTRVEVV